MFLGYLYYLRAPLEIKVLARTKKCEAHRPRLRSIFTCLLDVALIYIKTGFCISFNNRHHLDESADSTNQPAKCKWKERSKTAVMKAYVFIVHSEPARTSRLSYSR